MAFLVLWEVSLFEDACFLNSGSNNTILEACVHKPQLSRNILLNALVKLQSCYFDEKKGSAECVFGRCHFLSDKLLFYIAAYWDDAGSASTCHTDEVCFNDIVAKF